MLKAASKVLALPKRISDLLPAHPRVRPILLVSAFLLIVQTLYIYVEVPRSDQAQYLAYAYNSLKHGTFSANRSDSPYPDLRREPGYPLILMIGMALHPALDLDEVGAKCVTEGEGDCLFLVTWLKLINVALLVAVAYASYMIVLRFGAGRIAAAAAYLLIAFSGASSTYAGRFSPEVPAAALTLIGSYSLAVLASDVRKPLALAAGLLFAALTLTKALFHYVFIMIFLILVVYWFVRNATPRRQAVIVALVLAGAYATPVGFWGLRNLVSVGTADIAGRSGVVLLTRSHINTDHPPFRELLLSAVGKRSDDFAHEAKSRAYERRGDLKDQGIPVHEIDDRLGAEARSRVISNMPAHIAVIPYTMLRGSSGEWGLGMQTSRSAPPLGEVVFGIELPEITLEWRWWGPILVFCAFIGFVGWPLAGRWPLFWFLLPSALAWALLAGATHFIPRYGVQFIPVAVVNLAVGVAVLSRRTATTACRLSGRQLKPPHPAHQ